METVGRIICYGSTVAPADFWYCTNLVGINRLYYIHSGTGGYMHKGQSYDFKPNTLYYIPYTADFAPFCDASDPVLHTYIDFELIPPIISKDIFALDASKSDELSAAINVFVMGGELVQKNGGNLSMLFDDVPLWSLCKASVIYLVSRIASENGVEKITDKTVIKALECIHTKMSEKISVEYIARECYMNPDSFIRRFYRVVGVTPHAYLKNLRLRIARYLIEAGMSLSEVASQTGYSDAASLSHALKNSCKN